MKTNNNIPAYRFQGYTDAWELRKIFEIADRFDNLRVPIASSLRVSGSTPYYGANGIQDYVEGYTHEGEFILVAEDGANDLKNYPVNLVNGKIWVNNHAHVLQGKNSIADNKFLAFSINQTNIESLLVGGGRAKLNSDVLMNIELKLPSPAEQEAIGTFFSTLDQHITLHQRKLDTLKEQKKTYLKLLFPAKGQTQPALRFQGFEDDWKEVKLGEIYKFSQGLQVPVEEQFFEPREELVRFIRIVDLTCQNDDIRWVKKNKVGCVSREDIFFVRYGSVGEIGYGFEGIIANNLFKLNPLISLHSLFMYQQFKSQKFQNYLKDICGSTT
ncbi:TPA: restriction endonuclease subunit S, partial [Streptococcus suis]|nr:restriction endonuclease subunit S [Streptococcus suis]